MIPVGLIVVVLILVTAVGVILWINRSEYGMVGINVIGWLFLMAMCIAPAVLIPTSWYNDAVRDTTVLTNAGYSDVDVTWSNNQARYTDHDGRRCAAEIAAINEHEFTFERQPHCVEIQKVLR